MAGFLQKLFDQVNPFDNGKSYSNQNPQPARTVSQPRQAPPPAITKPLAIPTYNNQRQNIIDKTRSMPDIDTRGAVSKLWDQVNTLDNGRTWDNKKPTNNKDILQQSKQNVTNAAKAVVKPFWETGDYIQQSGQIGVNNIQDKLGVKGAKENADILRKARDESFQQGFARPVSTVGYAVDTVNPFSIAERAGEQNKLDIEAEERFNEATRIRNEMVKARQTGQMSKEEYAAADKELMAWQSAPLQQSMYNTDKFIRNLNGVNSDGSYRTPLQAGAGGAGDFLTLYTLGRNPVSGAGLKAAAAESGKSLLRKGVEETALSNVLNIAGQAGQGYSQGLTPAQIGQQVVTTGLLNSALMGAGYLKNANKLDAPPAQPTTSLVSKVDDTSMTPQMKSDLLQSQARATDPNVQATRSSIQGFKGTDPAYATRVANEPEMKQTNYLVDGRPVTTKLASKPSKQQKIFNTNDPYVYHTDATNAPIEKFSKNGIQPSKTGMSGKGVYMANTPDNTLGYTLNKLDEGTVYRIDKQGLIDEFGLYSKKNPTGVEFDESNGEILLSGNRAVPPKFIEVQQGGEWKPVAQQSLPKAYYQMAPKPKQDPLKTLKAEAQKYKSADEYLNKIVKNNGERIGNWRDIKPGDVNIGSVKVSEITSSLDMDKNMPFGSSSNNIAKLIEKGTSTTKLKPSDFTPGKAVDTPVMLVKNPDGVGYRIIDGNNRYLQALANGDKEIPAVFRDRSGGVKFTDLYNQATKLPNKPIVGPDLTVAQLAKKNPAREADSLQTVFEDAVNAGNRKAAQQALNAMPNDLKKPLQGILDDTFGQVKQSRFARGAAKSNEISPELQSSIKQKDTAYKPVTNAEQIAASEKLIKGGYKKAATQVNERLDAKLGTIDDQTVSDAITAIKALDYNGGDANLALATDMTDKLSAHLTKSGQTVQAASLLNNRTPEGMLYGARKVLKKAGVEVTPDIQRAIKDQIDKITKLTGEERDYAIAELKQGVGSLIPSTFSDKAIALWKAGLLTGIKTQTGNALSGASTLTMKTASNPLASAIDKGISLVTKQRTKTFTLRGLLSGGAEGVKKGYKSLKTGIDERDIAQLKYDTKQVNFGNSVAGRAAQKYTDTVFGLMSAADKPNYYANLRNNLQDIAKAEAINAGKKGAARRVFIKDFVENPPMKAVETATQAAKKAVFANDTLLSKGAAGVRNAVKDSQVASAGVDVVMPFTRVPSAVVTRLFDYTPVGAVKTIIQNARKGKFDQRALSEGLAESITGTGVIAIGFALASNGLMTGEYPDDAKERELWKLEGKQPNAIKVGGKWQSINYTSPAGQVLAVGKQIYDSKQGGASNTEAAGTAIAGGAQTVLGQSFLQGVQGALDVVSDPERNLKTIANRQASSIVPTIVGDTAKATDPLQRQANNPVEAIKARVPWANQTLLPKQDAFGAPLDRQSSALNTMVNPFRPSDVKEATPLNDELRRLQDTGAGVMPNTTEKTLTGGSGADKYSVKLNPQQVYDKNSAVGQQTKAAWEKIIADPRYQGLSDEDKSAVLKKAYTDINQTEKKSLLATQGIETKNNPTISEPTSYISGSSSSSSDDPRTKYEKAKQKYDSDKNTGKISDVEDIQRRRALENLRIQSNFSKDAVSLYSRSYKDIINFVNTNKDGKKLWDEVLALDKANVDAGKTSKLYNKNGSLKATVKVTKGKKAKKGKYDYTKRLISGTASTNALRRIVQGTKIKRKVVKA